MIKQYLFTVLLLLPSLTILNAQEDSIKTNDDWKWHWEWDDWKDMDFDFGFKINKPAISLQYGIADLKQDDLQNNSRLVDPNLIEIKLGYIKDKSTWATDNIIKHSYKFVYLSNESNKLAGKNADGAQVESDMWRFGFGGFKGYGYKIGENAAIIPYTGTTLNWTRIDFKYPNIQTLVPDSDDEILNQYDETFRFGTSAEGGIRIKPIENLILDAGYERSIVFQRHLFWKWAGSFIIEEAAQGMLDKFINEVFKSSPNAGPIVNFVLKNALAYGLYELRQTKMNWPFKSEAPMSYDQIKFGVTFVF